MGKMFCGSLGTKGETAADAWQARDLGAAPGHGRRARAGAPVIYSVGYAQLTPSGLARLMRVLAIDALIDARSIPNRRRPGFAKKNLVALLGRRYEWRGDELGGRAPVTAAALDRLARRLDGEEA